MVLLINLQVGVFVMDIEGVFFIVVVCVLLYLENCCVMDWYY